MAGHSRPAFLVAGEGGNELGFVAWRDGAVAVRHGFKGLGGQFGLTASAESGEAWSDPFGDGVRARGKRGNFARYATKLDWDRDALAFSVGASWLAESETVLGARFGDTIGTGGADTLFLDAGASFHPADDWLVTLDYRRGFSRSGAAGLIAGSAFQSSAWSADVQRTGLFARGDGLAFRISQPLRIETGGLNLNLPVGYDYATESTTFGRRELSLTPSGREMTSELRWFGPFAGGSLTASVFYRADPGHITSIREDRGAAVRWSAGF